MSFFKKNDDTFLYYQLKLLVTLFFICLSTAAYSSPTLILPESANHLRLTDFTAFYIDHSGKKSIEDIVKLDDEFKPLAKHQYTPSIQTVWRKLSVHNKSNLYIDWKILTSLSYLHEFNVFQGNGDHFKQILSLDKSSSFSDWPIPFGKLTIPLQLERNEKASIYIQYKVPGNLPFRMELYSTDKWQEFLVSDTLVNGVTLGILILCFLIMLAQLFIHPTVNLYYLFGFIVSGIILVTDISGYLVAFVWPSQIPIYSHLIALTIMLPLPPYFLFVANSLALRKNSPLLYWFYLVIVFSALLIIAFSFVANTAPEILLLSPIAAIALLITICIAITKKLPFAKYYAVTLFIHVLFLNVLVVVFMLHDDKMPLHIHDEVITQLGFTIEVIMFVSLFLYQKHKADKEFQATLLLNKQHRLEEDLAKERTILLEEIVSKKNHLLADVSHELRTPLTVLKLQVESLQHNLEDDVKLSYEAIDKKLNDMELLINDIYQLAQSDIGVLNVTLAPLKFPNCLLSYKEEFKKLISQYGHCSVFKNNLSHAVSVKGDLSRIMQVLYNLVKNSCSYTNSPGTIQLELNNDDKYLSISLLDSSPGVTTEQLDLIFNRLYRVESSRSRSTGGSGLGLAISKSLIDAHMGHIFAEHSALGGVKVNIQLPIIDIN